MKEVAILAKKFFNDKYTTNVDEFLNLLNNKIKLSDFIGQLYKFN